MPITASLVNTGIKSLSRVLCRVDDEQLTHIPQQGPLIIVSNHINFLEVPLIYTHLIPRRVTGFAKAESWDNPFLRPLFNLWEAIPLQRGQADLQAIKKCLEALEKGFIIGMAPEGTRSGHGRLQRGHPGVVTIALHSRVPIIPLAYYGGENFWHNLSHLKRTDFHIRVGRPFRLKTPFTSSSKEVRPQISDEIMFQLAALLPPPYRGEYSDLTKASSRYLEFISPAEI
jgi:1-acyl-sn-glycerol-3-phosphate acyltransferase